VSIVSRRSRQETRNVGLMKALMLASATRRAPMSLHLQHSPSVYLSRMPRSVSLAAASALHGSPLPSHSCAPLNPGCWSSLRPKVLSSARPTTMGAEAVAEV
jgi:hypothetical protein